MSTVVLYCWCNSDSASVLLYFTFKHMLNTHTKIKFAKLYYLVRALNGYEKSAIIVNLATKFHFRRFISTINVGFPFHIFHLY